MLVLGVKAWQNRQRHTVIHHNADGGQAIHQRHLGYSQTKPLISETQNTTNRPRHHTAQPVLPRRGFPGQGPDAARYPRQRGAAPISSWSGSSVLTLPDKTALTQRQRQ